MSTLTEKIRNISFWFLDFIKGGKIKKHFDEIKISIESNEMSYQTSLQNTKLKKILEHAAKTVPFYKGYGFESVQNFPVIDKNFMRDRISDFLSTDFDDSNRYQAVTSGSTGTPFKVFHDKNKKNRNSADTIYFAKRAGFSVGDKLIYLKIWSENNKKSPLQRWMQNIQPLDVIHLNDEKIRNFISEIENSNDSIGFLGYSSALELVARYLEKTKAAPINANIKSIISMSEGLNQYTKATLPRFFTVNPVSRYSNIENGIIAQQEVNGKDEFLINTASYFVEIFAFDADVPAKDGQLGRIIITDLYNYAMPMIRYDSGDVGAIIPGANNYFQSIEGRKLDLIYDTKGNLISSYIVYKNMWQYTEIAQYQFVQYGAKDYVFKINMAESFEKEEKLINEFKTYLGQDANFSVEYVAEIPLLASGKRKKIMNTFHK